MVKLHLISAAVLAIASVGPWTANALPVDTSDVAGSPQNGHPIITNPTYVNGGEQSLQRRGDEEQPTKTYYYGAGQITSGNLPGEPCNDNKGAPAGEDKGAEMPAPSPPSNDSSKPSDLPSHDNEKEQQSTGSSASGAASEVLDLHNQFRAKHSAPPLVWDATLADYAQKWSDRCVFEHSSGSYGENLAQGFSDWESVVTAWYDENSQYDYSNPGFKHGVGHFTQVVWVGTTKLGCAVADCNGSPLYTCSYDPAGNVVNGDAFKTNVLPN